MQFERHDRSKMATRSRVVLKDFAILHYLVRNYERTCHMLCALVEIIANLNRQYRVEFDCNQEVTFVRCARPIIYFNSFGDDF